MTSKKFFSLIKEGSIHLAPGTKVVDADSIATLVTAQEVLEKAQAEAAEFRKQVIEECEKEREQAQREGFAEGMKKWAAHLVQLQKKIDNVRDDMTRVLVPVAIKAAQKIVGREIEQSKDAIVDIVRNNLKAVSQHQNIKVYVSPDELDVIRDQKPKLLTVFDRLESLSIQAREDIGRGSCVIETEVGIINAEIENQWRQLEAAIENMMGASK